MWSVAFRQRVAHDMSVCPFLVRVVDLPTEFNADCVVTSRATDGGGHRYRPTPALEPLVHSKLSVSPCATANRSGDSTVVLVPYYADLCMASLARRKGSHKLPLAENPALRALEARLRAHLLRHEPEILQRPERYLFAFGRFFKDLVTHHTMLTQWERSFRHVNVLAIELLSQQGSLRKLSRQYPGALAVPYPSNYVAPPWAATGSSPREPRRAAVAAAFGLEEGMDANLRLRAALREQCLRRHPQRRRSARGGASTACTWIPPPGGHAASMYSSSTSNVVLPAYESHAQPCCGNEWQGWTESRPPAPRGVPCERTVPLAHAGTACSQAATR